MSKSDNQTSNAPAGDDPASAVVAHLRRAYEPPALESGVAFEKVLLLSGCNSGFFCPIPC